MQQQPNGQPSAQNAHNAMMNYRINALEQAVKAFGVQLQSYVPRVEYDLQLKGMQESVKRIEVSISDPETGLQAKMQIQKEALDKLLIRILWSIVGGFGSIIIAITIFYLTHLP